MNIELRSKTDKDGFTVVRSLLLISESPEESLLLDALGKDVGEDGIIAKVTGTLKLSDGYGEHYIELDAPAPTPVVEGYDKAAEALAADYTDGWIAQDKDGDICWFNERPERLEWFWGFRKNITGEARRIDRIAACPDWKASLRKIEGGRVVPIEGEAHAP